MAALTSDIGPKLWSQGFPLEQRRPYTGNIAASERIFWTSMSIQVDGVAQRYPASVTAMKALGLLAAGADANGNLYFTARTLNVRVKVTLAAAELITVVYGSTIDIDIQYNNGTSTAASIIQLLRRHAEASRLLRYVAGGTGASSPAALAFTAVPAIEMLGVPSIALNNEVASAQPIGPAVAFDVGYFGAGIDASAPPKVGQIGYLADDNTFTATPDGLALRCRIQKIENGFAYGALQEAE